MTCVIKDRNEDGVTAAADLHIGTNRKFVVSTKLRPLYAPKYKISGGKADRA
jgi:hypothetical protein